MEKPLPILCRSLALAALISLGLVLAQPAWAAGPFTVDTTSDTHAVAPTVSPNDSGGHVSLRSAIEAANAQAGPTTINLPSATISLSLGELSVAPNGGKTISITGAGSATGIVAQTDGVNRVFNIDANSVGGTTVTISGLTISGGHDQTDILGGAGILAGSVVSVPVDNLTLQDCTISGNHCRAPNSTYTGQEGGGVQMAGGNLTVISCTFSGNSSAASQGGAIAFEEPSLVNSASAGTLSISGSIFSNNSLTNGSGSGPDGGGAVYINTTAPAVHSISSSTFSGNYVLGNLGATFGAAILLNTGTLNVDHSTFTGNSAGGQGARGGAVYVDSGTLNLSFCRLAGNTASNGGSGVYNHGSNLANTTAQNNWWGCNGGPGSAACDQVGSDGGTMNFTPWIVFIHTASPNPILVGQPTTLTATFRQNSSGTPLTQADVSVLAGVPITFGGAILGTISAPQAGIQPDGTAAATFTAGSSPGTGHANATVDSSSVSANITINQPPAVTTQPSNQAVCPGTAASFNAAASGTPAPGVQWQNSTDNGSTWANITGATAATLTVPGVTPSQNGNQYRAVFTSIAGIATSTPATLTVNATPVAGPDTLGTSENVGVNALVAKLLANDSSPINGPLTISAVTSPSTAGGTVALSGASFTYTPANNFVGTDSFTYTLSDGRCTSQGTVSLIVSPSNTQTLNVISITVTSSSRILQFAGIPSKTYVVQWAPEGDGPWTDFADGTLTAGTTGVITYTDTTSPAPATRFYRTRLGP
jgi:Big-like domain-containing protein/immunoglobulin I-set domain protein/polymorphic membrane protein